VSAPDLRLDWCSHEAARYACEHWHYSGCLSKGRQHYVGVWEGGRYIGCVVFARSSSPNLGDAFGLTQWECVELTRVALAAHTVPVSRVVAVALRLLRRRNPGLQVVVSYADPRQGHLGGIYQAGGWVYLGTSAPRMEFWVRGKWRTDTHAWRLRGPATPKRRIPGKHKYLFPLDAATRGRIAPLARPYPKPSGRASRESEAPAVQAGEGAAMRPHGSNLCHPAGVGLGQGFQRSA
jgi:hypothetical protein